MGLQLPEFNYKMEPLGEVSERLKEHAWKACVLETVPWVRIPPSPDGKNSDFCLETGMKMNNKKKRVQEPGNAAL
jgi:hypothetical protein